MSIEYDESIVDPPKYLTLDVFNDILENARRQTGLEIVNVKFTMGSSTGENYCSLIYRVSIFYKIPPFKNGCNDECISIIIKSMPISEGSQFILDLEAFQKEKICYNEILPRMEMLLDDNVTKFGPRLYHSIKQPINTLIFEDLGSIKKFEMANREIGLDEIQSKMVLKRLAQFHAISMILAQKDPEIIKTFHSGLLAKSCLENDDSFHIRYFSNNIDSLINLIESWSGYEKITEKLRIYRKNFRQNLIKAQSPHNNELRVLNHGDLWVNNVLFKYDANRQPKDVIFIDFQLSIWGSPGYDINYFFYTSVQLETLQYKRDHLLRTYYDEFYSTLNRLNYTNTIPSYQLICDEVREREPYGFFANYGIFPLICMEKESCSDNKLDNFADDNFLAMKMKQMFSSKRLEAMFRYTLKRFDDLGIFD